MSQMSLVFALVTPLAGLLFGLQFMRRVQLQHLNASHASGFLAGLFMWLLMGFVLFDGLIRVGFIAVCAGVYLPAIVTMLHARNAKRSD